MKAVLMAVVALLGAALLSFTFISLFPNTFASLWGKKYGTVQHNGQTVTLRVAPAWFRLLRLFTGGRTMAATTFGRTVLFMHEALLDLHVRRYLRRMHHELRHTEQWGPLFLLRYVVYHVRYGYDANPYELDADEYAAEHAAEPVVIEKEA